jgi:hypothetical protein
MRSTTSLTCATTPRSSHDLFDDEGDIGRPNGLGCPQGSPVSSVQIHVFERVVRGTNLSSLQGLECLAERCATTELSLRMRGAGDRSFSASMRDCRQPPPPAPPGQVALCQAVSCRPICAGLNLNGGMQDHGYNGSWTEAQMPEMRDQVL